MKRTLTALTAVLLLAGTSAFAQAPAAPVKMEASPFSPFVYEALGATPKIQPHMARAARAAPAPKAAALREEGTGTANAAASPAPVAGATIRAAGATR